MTTSTPQDCPRQPYRVDLQPPGPRSPVVLAVQDTTEVNWTSHPATTGLGPLGHTACRGLHVHSTLAFTPDRVPLGLFAQHVWARDPDDVGKRQRRKQVPIHPEGKPEMAHQS